jgi:protein-S-isoprenylcysteine O-methyltransferase Ste14
MKVSALAFRLRVVIFLLLYLMGFLPQWERRVAGGGTLWLAASALLARTGWIGLAAATLMVTIAALACLLLGTILRVWGTAFLGPGVMQSAAMQGEQFVAGGPYGYVRNPLYLGAWLLALGTCILMPPSGALFFVPAFSSFVLFLIFTEECFLATKQADLYQQYCRRVPRLLPRPGAAAAGTVVRPHWLQAVLAETYPLAFTLCFAIFAWRYNAHILIRCLLICYGLSLVMRALAKGQPSAA